MPDDIFVAQSQAADALVGPLHTVTYLTAHFDTLDQTLVQGLSQTRTGTLDPSESQRPELERYLGLRSCGAWRARCYNSAGANRNVQIRTVSVPADKPVVRPDLDGSILGGLSIGFPMRRFTEREKRMLGVGVQSSIGLKELDFTSPTGDVYTSGEIHFIAAENVFLLGVQRPDVFIPVGPMRSDDDIGGPAYSARCVSGTDKLIGFFENALGYECRRDMTMTVGERSGLKLTEGDPERFVQLFAPGANTGYLVLLDHEHGTKPSPAPTLGPPSRGVVMWSFPTRDLDTLLARVAEHGGKIKQQAATRHSPFLPAARTAIVEDPDGFDLEFFET